MQHWVRALLEDVIGPNPALSDMQRAGLARLVALVESQDVHVFRQEDLDHLCDQIADCAGVEALSSLLTEAARLCGFRHFSVFLLRQGESIAFRTRVCTSMPTDWLERYGRQSYQYVDPVIARAMTDDRPFLFSELQSDLPIVKAFWDDAARHGVGPDGLCAAFELPGGARIGASFTAAPSNPDVAETLRYNATDALCIARLAVETFNYLGRATPQSADNLTAAELRFLHLLVTHDAPEDIVSALPDGGIGPSICRKLGVKSLLQAVAVASVNHWFDDLPYEMTDVSRAHTDPHIPLTALRALTGG